MAIYQKDGHWYSERTYEESQRILANKLKNISDVERMLAQHVLQEMAAGNLGAMLGLAEYQWETVPVPIEQWIEDPYYIGDIGGSLYTPVREALIELFQVPCFESDFQEIILTGGFGWGKSVLSGLIILRILYELVCLKNPQATLGLMPGTKIYIMPIAHRVETARDVVFGEIVEKLRLIDFFRGRYKETLDEVRFKDKGIYIKGGASGDNAILGLTIFAAIIDESNFFGKQKKSTAAHETRGKIHDRAEGIYEGLQKRIKSRFAGDGSGRGNQAGSRQQRSKATGRAVTGKLIMASSKRGVNDFTERRIRRAMEEGRSDVFVRDLPTWEKDPEAFSEIPRFPVLARSEAGVSRILEPDEDYKPKGKELIVWVPENWRKDFEDNPDKALRDVAGIATEGFDPFIKRRDTIKAAMTRGMPKIFSSETWDTDGPLDIYWSKCMTSDAAGRPVPRCCPTSPRHVHLDMSANECATGFVIGHKGPEVELMRVKEDTREVSYERVPTIHFDGILKITVPQIGEIHHPSVRQLVKNLHDGGFMVNTIGMDQWCYTTNKQEFEAWGFTCVQLSVTRKPDPYVCMKQGFYDNRYWMPWHEKLRIELYDLEKDPKTGKIKHPDRSSDGKSAGSRDVADAATGLVYYLTHVDETSGVVVLPSRGISEGDPSLIVPGFSPEYGPSFESEREARSRRERRRRRGKKKSDSGGSTSAGNSSPPVFGII